MRKWMQPWQREGSGGFDSRATETEFLDRPDCDPALAAAIALFSCQAKNEDLIIARSIQALLTLR